MSEKQGYEGYAILEVMGHRRLAGYVSEATIAGAPMLRIDVPGKDTDSPTKATQFYGGASIFCLTPTTEEQARKEANQPAWDAPIPFQLTARGDNEDEDDSQPGDAG